ncbi:MAG: FMN-binding protein [Dehalobacter sp.]|nr:FMN-binding protein [Dehalobacter sp.]
MSIQNVTLPVQAKSKKLERILGLFAVVTIFIAWFAGDALQGYTYEDYLGLALPRASRFVQIASGIYAGLEEDGSTIGYIAIGEATGYGGPMDVAVAVDLDGKITGFSQVEHKETPSYIEKVYKNPFVEELLGKSYADPFKLAEDIDGVTQATYTSNAIAEALRNASRNIAGNVLDEPVPPETTPSIKFGIPEITLVLLFLAGFLGRRKVIRNLKLLRWSTMLGGLVILGFLYNQPLTISKINTFLLGYWPDWQNNLYWYLLLGGIIFVCTAENLNPYCEWFCPFGAAQECMGAIGGAKGRFTKRQQQWLIWAQRFLSWMAIVVALLMRNPGISSYEVFGTLFNLNGSTLSFLVLGIVLLTSLFVHRFWCRTLCPIRPVEGFIRMIRGWLIELWKRKIKTV